MCGVAGILQFGDHHHPEEMRRWAEAMASSLEHRGPDDAGVWVSDDGRCSLAHRRLSIIDTSSAGHQPMHAADGRAVITFNGEIYNYLELRPELEAKGRRFRTRTDTEVLIEAVREWGGLAFPRIDGMYAFAQYDLDTRELCLARDPFGEKPLYYLHDGKRLAFASELHALQQLPFFDDAIGEDAMAEFLAFQYVGAPRTLYRSVSKLPPGCAMRVRRDGHASIHRYFEFRPGVEPHAPERSLDDLADELEEILVRLLERRMIADVPLGAFLSGGVDSSTVCALVRRKLDLPLQTFSIGWTGSNESEHEQARRFAEHLGTEHRDQQLAPDSTDFLLHAGDRLDEPNGDSSCLPTYLLSEFARRHVTVAISGDGGDEMFGGYGRYFSGLRKERRTRSRGRPPAVGSQYYGGMILFCEDDDLRVLFGRVPGELADRLGRLRAYLDRDDPTADLLMRMRKTDVDHYMPGAVLAKVDRMSMQHSLEVRTPFLAIELARFAERLPSSALVREGQGKAVLRQLAARYLPREWLDLPKKGFGLPMHEGWGQRELIDVVSAQVQAPDGAFASVVGVDRVARFLERQRDPQHTHIYKLWALGVLESYLRKRPATLPPRRDVAVLREIETPSLHPMASRLARDAGKRFGEMVLFCGESVPAWRRQVPVPITVVAPFDAESDDGERFVRADWAARKGDGLRALEGQVAEGSAAVFCAAVAPTVATPEFCERLLALGFETIAFGADEELGSTLIDLAAYCGFARSCQRSWWPAGVRIGGWRRRVRHRRGHQFRWRSAQVTRRVGKGASEDAADHLAVVEGRRPLLLGGAPEDEISAHGRGRFRVDANAVGFAATDSSDVARNRRRYGLVDLRRRGVAPWWRVNDATPSLAEYRAALARWIDADDGAVPPARAPRPGDTIALVTETLFAGGAERQWIYLGRELMARGFRVVLFAVDLSGAKGHYLPMAQRAGIEVRDLSALQPRFDPVLAPDALDAATVLLASATPREMDTPVWRLTRELRAIGADYVACQLDAPNVFGGLAGLFAGARRVLLSFRNANPSNFPTLFKPWYRDYYLALAASPRVRLSGNSRAGNDDYARWLGVAGSDIHTIHNGFSPEGFASLADGAGDALRRELGIAPDAPVVSALFRWSEEKDPATFLDVARRLVSARDDVVVLHAGDGPGLAAARREIGDSGLGARIRLLGTRRDSGALLRASQLLLMTSTFEGLSNALLEAQFFAVPIVATAVGGTPELVTDGETGLLAEARDAEALARHGLDLLADPERCRRLGEAGRRRVTEHFSIERLASETLAVLGS